MRFFDAHNHLQDERFAGRQAGLVEACRAAGIVRMVVNGSCEDDWPAVAALAREFPGLVIPAFGIHPWYVHERTPRWRDTLLALLDSTPGAVVGEIGLDRWILDRPRPGQSPAPIEEQFEVFAEQLRIAAERDVAASLHCLQAWGPMFETLRAGPRPARGFLLHSYGGSAEMVTPLVRLGAYFSFPGYFLHERKARQRETFRTVPADRLLAETDSPDQPLPGAEELARVLGTVDASDACVPLELLGTENGRVDRETAVDLTTEAPRHRDSRDSAEDQPQAADERREPEDAPNPPQSLRLCVSAAKPTAVPRLNHPANLPLVYRGLAAVRREDAEAMAVRIEANFVRLFAG